MNLMWKRRNYASHWKRCDESFCGLGVQKMFLKRNRTQQPLKKDGQIS